MKADANKGGRASGAAPGGADNGDSQEDNQRFVDEVVNVFDSGLYREGIERTFNVWLFSTHGRRTEATTLARQGVVRTLDSRGKTAREIAEETGLPYPTVIKDLRALNGPKYVRKKRKAEPTPEQVRARERRQRHKGIGDRNAENLYAAMCNAPAGARCIPMMNRATAAVQALTELAVLDPRVAASQVAGVRVREYSGAGPTATWWAEFIKACEERRQAECPALGHLKWSPKWTPEGKLNAEHGPVVRAILDLLAIHGRATEAELGVGIATANIGRVLRDLADKGHITADADGFYVTGTGPVQRGTA